MKTLSAHTENTETGPLHMVLSERNNNERKLKKIRRNTLARTKRQQIEADQTCKPFPFRYGEKVCIK